MRPHPRSTCSAARPARPHLRLWSAAALAASRGGLLVRPGADHLRPHRARRAGEGGARHAGARRGARGPAGVLRAADHRQGCVGHDLVPRRRPMGRQPAPARPDAPHPHLRERLRAARRRAAEQRRHRGPAAHLRDPLLRGPHARQPGARPDLRQARRRADRPRPRRADLHRPGAGRGGRDRRTRRGRSTRRSRPPCWTSCAGSGPRASPRGTSRQEKTRPDGRAEDFPLPQRQCRPVQSNRPLACASMV